MLPDEVLLAIFDLLVDESRSAGKKEIEAWQSLVHVCQQWRRVVFGSPRRLNLRLVCTSKTPVRDMLTIWPAFPLFIMASVVDTSGVNNIIAVLEHRDRVRRIRVDFMDVPSLLSKRVSAAMQEPFPELICLVLSNYGMSRPMLALPDSFLGGSSPRLQQLCLRGIPFPGLPKLLLSATHLVRLTLEDIPHTGYISPEAMVTALSLLTNLRRFRLEFKSPQSRPYQESRRPPLTRSVLVLTDLAFKGVCEYLDNLVAHIDTPQLTKLDITFLDQVAFDAPQLVQFICRTEALKTLEKARLTCCIGAAMVKLSPQASHSTFLHVVIPCRELDRQIWSLGQVFALCLPPLSELKDFYIYGDCQPDWQLGWEDNMVDALWLELLYPFTAAKNLYITEEFAQRIVPALQQLVGARMTQVFPALRNIFLEGLRSSGPVQESVGHFAAARQAIGHPIAVSRWDRDRTTFYEVDN